MAEDVLSQLQRLLALYLPGAVLMQSQAAREHRARMAGLDAKWDRRERILRWLPLGLAVAVFLVVALS